MFKRILVPLDGSELSELALPYAEELAGSLNSEVELVYVCEPEENQYRHMHQLYIEKIAQTARNHIKAYPTRETNTAAPVKPVILDGDPAAEIIDYAERNDISLVVMVSHGRSGIMPWSMGSVAGRVMRGISKPVLFIRGSALSLKVGKEEIFNKILVPLDGSETGEAALPYVKGLTEKLKSEVTLLEVVAPGQHVHTIGGLDYVLFPEEEIEHLRTVAKQNLEEAGKKLADTRAIVKYEVKTGNAAQEIIKLADETNARLIAISTYGQTGIRRWISGSVTDKVLQAGHTPVLLVRALQAKS
ncbi:universal stress protein [Chloroflexota bacterium]